MEIQESMALVLPSMEEPDPQEWQVAAQEAATKYMIDLSDRHTVPLTPMSIFGMLQKCSVYIASGVLTAQDLVSRIDVELGDEYLDQLLELVEASILPPIKQSGRIQFFGSWDGEHKPHYNY